MRYIKHLILSVTQRGRSVKVLRMDDEFVTEEIRNYLAEQHISIRPCIPHEHSTLPYAERDNRTIQEAVVKAIVAKPHLTYKYWGLAFHDIIMKWNIFSSRESPDISPYETWFGYRYNMHDNPLIPFGSIVKAHIPLNLQTTMSGRSIDTHYVGFAPSYKGGIQVYNPKTKRCIIRRSFKITGPTYQPDLTITLESPDIKSDNIDHAPIPPVVTEDTDDSDDMPQLVGDDDSDDEDDTPQFGSDIVMDHDPLDGPYNEHVPIVSDTPLENDEFYIEKIINHKGRGKKMQFWVKWLGYGDEDNSWVPWSEAHDLAALDTYLLNNPDIKVPHQIVHQVTTSNKILKKNRKKKVKLNEDDKFIPPIFNYLPPKASRGALKEDAFSEYMQDHYAFASHSSSAKDIPRNFSSIKHFNDANHWFNATKNELHSFVDNTVWKLPNVDLKDIPKNLILPSMLIYDKQYNPDGSFKKYKCRLVIRGDKWYDIYNMNTYASTVKSESVRMMLAIAGIEDWEMESVDVKTAFLNSPLKEGEIIYMRRPPGLGDTHMPEIVQLNKCIYGMPEASAYFHEHSDKVLRSFNCNPIPEDDCVYRLDLNGETAFVLKHVDDFGIMAKNKKLIDYIKFKLSQSYEISVNKDMTFYLGLCINRDRIHRTMTLNQSGYIQNNLIDRFNIKTMDKYPSTPMAYFTSKSAKEIITLLDKDGITDYQSRVGSLLYLAIMTRPDILYAVSMASCKCKSPTSKDLSAVNRILYYIAGTPDLGLRFFSDEGVVLYATVDASYACHDDLKSHTGCTLHIGRSSGACQSLSKKQTITADSSTVAEFVATHTVSKEVMWARDFFKKCWISSRLPYYFV